MSKSSTTESQFPANSKSQDLQVGNVFLQRSDEVLSVDVGSNKPVLALENGNIFHVTNLLKAQGVPNSLTGNVGLKNKIEHTVNVSKLRSPVKILLAHLLSKTKTSDLVVHDKTGIANVGASANVVWLNVEIAQELLAPEGLILAKVFLVEVSVHQNGSHALKEIGKVLLVRHLLNERVGLAFLYDIVELVVKHFQKSSWKIVWQISGDQCDWSSVLLKIERAAFGDFRSIFVLSVSEWKGLQEAKVVGHCGVSRGSGVGFVMRIPF